MPNGREQWEKCSKYLLISAAIQIAYAKKRFL